MATVVAKLFNLVQPDVAVLGEKDWQQLQVIRRMVADLDFPIEVVSVPTVREADGLALSSRNRYLTPEERALAPSLYQILRQIVAQVDGGRTDYARLEMEGLALLATAGFTPEYVSIRAAGGLLPPEPGNTQRIVLAAVRLGKTRLIDNILV